MTIFNKYKLTILGMLLGTIGGFAYYHYVGCSNGTCPITSRPLNSITYGALLGGLLFNIFQKEEKN